MNLKSFTYPEEKKLKSRKLIKQVFEEGKTIKAFPLLIRYTEHEGELHKVGVSVSKRNFKTAVDRNRIKRQLREAYRLHQQELTDSGSKFAVMLIYIGRKKMPTVKIQETLKSLLKELK